MLDAIKRFELVAPAILRGWFSDDSCLNATRVVLEVCASIGVPSRAVSVTTVVMNEKWMRLVHEIKRMPTEQEMQDWTKRGAWALGNEISGAATPRGWCGHIVAILGEDEYLVDASARQFCRPEKNISAPDVVVVRGNMPLVTRPGSAFLSYHERPGDKSFRVLPGFQRTPWNLECAAEIIAAMRRIPWRLHALDIIGAAT